VPYKQPPVTINPQDYVSLTFSGSVLGDGFEICEGVEQKTLSFFDLGGGSVNIYIGKVPKPDDLVTEIGLGLGRHIGVGHFFGDPDASGSMQFGGLVFHLGFGIATPVHMSTTFPEGVDPIRGHYDNR
jgi:hypothetical protein